MRRQPQLQRGQRRVDAILRAAVAVFDARGFEAATTNAIARRARASIGSLYQFFPNKEAILQAVVTRHRAELTALFANLMTVETLRLPTAVIVDQVIDGAAEFITTHIGFGRIFWHSPASPRLAAIAAQLDDEIVARVDAGFALRYPRLTARRRRLHAAVTVTMLKALLALADSSSPRDRGLVLAEVKSVLAHYLDQIDSR
jgi:AcrR family transcriptional regulator